MPELALINYRADPNNRSFSKVCQIYRPWLRMNGMWTLNKFPTLSPTGDLDDLTNEGLLAISRSARRYVFFCTVCGKAFIQKVDLSNHAMIEHRIRGAASLVSLKTFVEVSAKLAMKRTAQRLIKPEEILDPNPDVGIIYFSEEEILIELLIQKASERLSVEALKVLKRILLSDRPRYITSSLIKELRSEFSDL